MMADFRLTIAELRTSEAGMLFIFNWLDSVAIAKDCDRNATQELTLVHVRRLGCYIGLQEIGHDES
jgi:hypothetical protein